ARRGSYTRTRSCRLVELQRIGRFQREQVVPHRLAVTSVGGPAIAGAGAVLGVALAERSQEVAPAAHPRFALDVLDAEATPAVVRRASETRRKAAVVAGEDRQSDAGRDRIAAGLATDAADHADSSGRSPCCHTSGRASTSR